MPEIRIIHTSDFHDCLTPEKAALLRRLKEEHGALLIDAGDAVRALNVTVMPWRERAVGFPLLLQKEQRIGEGKVAGTLVVIGEVVEGDFDDTLEDDARDLLDVEEAVGFADL